MDRHPRGHRYCGGAPQHRKQADGSARLSTAVTIRPRTVDTVTRMSVRHRNAPRPQLRVAVEGMRFRIAAVGLLAIGVLSSCRGTETSGSSSDFAASDAVLCRELGGGWVHIRYEADEATFRQTRFGLPTQGNLTGEPTVSESELDRASQLRAANGWDEAALESLQQPDVPAQTEARLSKMPSCLDELRQR